MGRAVFGSCLPVAGGGHVAFACECFHPFVEESVFFSGDWAFAADHVEDL